MNECVCYGEPHGVECDYCIAKTTLDRFESLASVFKLALEMQEHCDAHVATEREACAAIADSVARQGHEEMDHSTEKRPSWIEGRMRSVVAEDIARAIRGRRKEGDSQT